MHDSAISEVKRFVGALYATQRAGRADYEGANDEIAPMSANVARALRATSAASFALTLCLSSRAIAVSTRAIVSGCPQSRTGKG